MSEKSDFKGWLKQELDELRRVRDELRVQASLGKAELRDRWHVLERGFESLESKVKRTSDAAEEPLRQLEALSDRPVENWYEFTGIGEIRKLEDKYLPADAVEQKYAHTAGHKPGDRENKEGVTG